MEMTPAAQKSLAASHRELYERLENLLDAVDAAAKIRRGDFYHERKEGRLAIAAARKLETGR